jgi:CheY-like chemotaxis protein
MLHCHVGGTPTPGPRGSAGNDLPAALRNAPVLIVEDEAMIAWTMESLLDEMGFARIAIAASGESAIVQAGKLPPRLIVSDINLGHAQMDGVAAAVAILARAAASVVFVTGNASAEARARIDREVPGAIVLAKPVAPEELRRAILLATAPGN